ncbi:hypothetical protein KI387_036591, partial [Taxus chinensis]
SDLMVGVMDGFKEGSHFGGGLGYFELDWLMMGALGEGPEPKVDGDDVELDCLGGLGLRERS